MNGVVALGGCGGKVEVADVCAGDVVFVNVCNGGVILVVSRDST